MYDLSSLLCSRNWSDWGLGWAASMRRFGQLGQTIHNCLKFSQMSQQNKIFHVPVGVRLSLLNPDWNRSWLRMYSLSSCAFWYGLAYFSYEWDRVPFSLFLLTWTASREKVFSKYIPNNEVGWSCASAHSHQGLCFALKHSTVHSVSLNGQWMPRSVCACADWSGPSLSAFARRNIFVYRDANNLKKGFKHAFLDKFRFNPC